MIEFNQFVWIESTIKISCSILRDASLNLAALNGHIEVVQSLLKHGSEVTATGANQWTALHNAATGGHMNVVAVLIESGSNIESRDCNGLVDLHQTYLDEDIIKSSIILNKAKIFLILSHGSFTGKWVKYRKQGLQWVSWFDENVEANFNHNEIFNEAKIVILDF